MGLHSSFELDLGLSHQMKFETWLTHFCGGRLGRKQLLRNIVSSMSHTSNGPLASLVRLFSRIDHG